MQTLTQDNKIVCSMTDCNKIFKLFKSYQLHLKLTHSVDTHDEIFHFDNFKGIFTYYLQIIN